MNCVRGMLNTSRTRKKKNNLNEEETSHMPLRMQAELSTLLFLTQLLVSFTQAISVCLFLKKKTKPLNKVMFFKIKKKQVYESLLHRLKFCLYAE